jgi:Fungal protein kinase
VTDRAGQVETDSITFDRTSTTLTFVRMVMGFAFLPDSYLGFDTTINRLDNGTPVPVSDNGEFKTAYPPFEYRISNPIQTFVSDTSIGIIPPPTASNGDYDASGDGIVNITVKSKTYEVIRLIFRAQTLIGRATRAFLVKLPDGRLGVIKDSWITTDRPTEASFLQGLNIPFGPEIIDHCVLGNTDTFRENPIRMPIIQERREKRRVVTYPAGVHISDFSSLWELMAAMLDVVIGMASSPFFFDCSSNFF